MKLLLIDDNPSITTMYSKYLTVKGHYQCTVINDGKEGLDRIKKDNFDVVLLDLALPKFSGLDLINSLVDDGTIKDHKIIVLSASHMTDTETTKLLEKGVLACFEKPVQLKTLLETIENIS